MFSGGDQLDLENDQDNPVGLRISAALLIALGFLFAIYVLLFGFVLGVSVLQYWHGKSDELSSSLKLFAVVVTNAVFTYLCFSAAAALRDRRRWGAYIATGFGLLLLAFSGMFFYDWFHPERQGPDEYFGILIVPFLVVIGLWWCIYPNLPHVRAHLNKTPIRDLGSHRGNTLP